MRRIAIVGMILLSLVAVPLVAAAAPTSKTDVCHVQDDGSLKTLSVGGKAAAAHLNHGDTEGACDEAPPAGEIPPPELTATFTYGTPDCFMGLCTFILTASSNGVEPLLYSWSIDGNPWPHHTSQLVVMISSGGSSTVSLEIDDGTQTAYYQETITAP